ncbi:hydroxyisourate hydrolase [Streptomyces sp. SID4919]|uniref:hydroxyisourate hydrolase n=1 Tax=unclassified Streptomyces TaxID=2593676 RepID=UPI000823C7ED|nr:MULTISPECIES: hydroxyisourate hydrolase [unclassified Streptomyces]MYY10470.1 hydroxyisourate hydrolase [Streptomyces sp. SID4919]SCK46731.1 5-hydroxyisourate hydrolase [Streptomyces sp. AmelKG-E11A]
MSADTVPRPPSVSTHVLDTARGRPAEGVAVRLAARPGPGDPWRHLGGARTDADGRCADLPAPPLDTAHVRLDFEVGPYTGPPRDGTGPAFFPEVAVTFAVVAGEHYHVPLLLSPFGYSVYRGS